MLMLPTFVIGLREGLEAALIVGIVAAFLRQRGRLDLLRWALVGVAAAVVLCLGIGIVLEVISHDLPQKQQEGLETVIGSVAVLMVTYMVVWMRRNSRTLKAQLEGAAESALAAGSGFALVLMAFLAVLREGLETVVFLIAAFNQSGSGPLSATGAVLGIVLAVLIGWGIYRGGVKLNLSKFFRFTGLVLTFVAAGLVVSALHTAHEAGWLNWGQQQTVDLSALVRPGSVQAALLTGMLGVQPRPVVIEIVGWLLYLIPVGLYVGWPPGKGLANATVRRLLTVGGAAVVIAAIVLTVLAPGRPAPRPVTKFAATASAQVASLNSDRAVLDAAVLHPAQPALAASRTRFTATATSSGAQSVGLSTSTYQATISGPVAGAPTTMTLAQLAATNGGRLPLGVRAGDGTESVPVKVESKDVGTFRIEARTGRIVDIAWHETTSLTASLSIGPTLMGTPTDATWQLPTAQVTAATAAARADVDQLDRRSLLFTLALVGWLLAGLAAVIVTVLALVNHRRRPGAEVGQPSAPLGPVGESASGAASSTPQSDLVKS
jgi:high-affinity iron transporter